jgi:phosphatidate cytidylyltransferase
MKAIDSIVRFFKNTSELNQRVFFGILMVLIFCVPVLLGGKPFVLLLIALCVLVSVEYVVIIKNPSTFTMLFIIFEFFLVFLLRESNTGLQKIVLIAFIIAIFDTSAYFAGKAFGKHKLCPSISPGKTIEGFIGGILCVVIASIPLYYILSCKISLAFYTIFVIILATLSQIGDVLESAFKRRNGVKDSSKLIPGHGGVLDRFDGYILTVPVFFIVNMVVNLF